TIAETTPADSTSGQNTSANSTSDSDLEKRELAKQVVSATGFAQELRDAPASISIVTGKELQERPVRDIAEAVSLLPGVSIDTGATSFGGYSISIRGMPSSYTLLLVDSKRQDASSEAFPNVSFSQAAFMPPLAAIDRIEVIRGPASTIYGSDAIGGVVNVITKRSFDKWASNILLNTTLQEENIFGHSVGVSAYTAGPIDKAKKWSVQLRAKDTHQFQSGSTDISGVPTNPTNPNAAMPTIASASIIGAGQNNQYQAGARIGYEMSEKNYLYVDYSHFGSWYDPTIFENSVFNRNNAIVRHQGRYGANGTIRTDTSIQYNANHNASRKRLAQDVILEHRTSLPFWRMKLNVGGQYIYNSVAAQYGTVFGGDVGNFMDRHTYALYLDDQWAIVDSLLLNVGVRLNMDSNFGFNASPRAYLVWNALEGSAIGDLTFKGGISTGYILPTLTQIAPGWGSSTGQGAIRVFGNPDLKPESSTNYELSVMHETDYTQVSLTGFFTQFYDKITSMTVAVNGQMPAGFICNATSNPNRPTISPSCQYSYNVDTAQSYGIEVYGQIKPFSVGIGELGLNASYTWNRSRSTSGATNGMPLANIPEHSLNGAINYTWNNLGVYVRGEFKARQMRTNVLGRTVTQAGLDTWKRNNPGRSEFYEPYFLLHLGANYQITKTLRANFGIYNLLNHNFVDYYVSYTNAAQTAGTLYNNYASIYEGRRYYIALSMDF
ncbi:ferric receptor CfrA, partial [Helicobacter sp. CLO-3]